MDVGAIPWTAAIAWAKEHRIKRGADRDLFWHLVQACDDEWHQVQRETREQAEKDKQANNERQKKFGTTLRRP